MERSVPIIQEVPKPYREVETVYVKGDTEEVIREVDRLVEKPIIREVLQIREVHVEKPVPLWVREEKPVLIELKIPFIQNQVEIVTCERERIVPFREEVQLEVIREIPVPIVCEKEIIRPVRVIVEKIVEVMVEVPRVVEVEKIVEKIVVVPRIVESIVQVPQIVEKIVEREIEVLKIIELPMEVPTYLLREVQQIVPEIVERPVEVVTIQPVEVERPVYLKIETEVMREVKVKEEVPVEVIHERDVLVVQEKIVDRVVTVREIEIRDREVVIPFRHEVPIEVIQERAVEIKKIIENIVQVPQIIERDKVLYETRIELQVVEVLVDKPIDRVEKVVYTDVHNHIEYQPQVVHLTNEVLALQTEKTEVIKPEPYFVEKIVVQNNIHQEAVPVYLEKAVPCKKEVIVPVEVPVPVIALKEVPKELIKEKVVAVRTFIESNREVPVQVEKIVQIDSIRPEIVETTRELLKVIVEHQQQEVVQQVAVVEERNTYVEVPAKPIIVQEYREIYRDNTEPLLLEKVVERVTILPQIVEVLKHIHEITDDNIAGIGLGVAELGVDVQVHTADYITLCTDLRVKLEAMLATLRNSRQPEARENTVAIEQLIVMLRSLAAFPNIVQIPRYIDKVVEKPVVVPTKDTETVNREIAATAMIEKLVEELKRIERTGVRLELDNDLKSIFFLELKSIERMDDKLRQFSSVVLNRFKALGNWTDQHSLMLNNYLQERFLLAGIVKESNEKITVLKKELELAETDRTKLTDALTKLSIINVGLKNSLEELIKSLKESISIQGGQSNLETILLRAQETLNQFEGNAMRESRFKYAAQDSERLARELRSLEKELESYRGGESNRNSILSTQTNNLRREIEILTNENHRLKQQLQERGLDSSFKDTIELAREIDSLNRSKLDQRDEFERTIRRMAEDHQRQIATFNRDPRILTSTITDRSPEEERLKGVQRSLEEKIVGLSRDLNNEVNAHTQAKLTITRLQAENSDLKRRLEEALNRSTSTQFSSNITTPGIEEQRWRAEEQRLRNEEQRLRSSYDQVRSSYDQMRSSFDQVNTQLTQNVHELNKSRRENENVRVENSQLFEELQRTKEDNERMKRLYESKTSADRERGLQYGEEQDKMRSPENRPGDRKGGYNTPAAQLRMTSPDVPEVQEEEYSETSSSQVRGLSQSQTYRPTRSVTLRQVINERLDDVKVAKIILLLCSRVEQDVHEGRRQLYTPDNIVLENYNPEDLKNVRVSLNSAIDPRLSSRDRKYLPPEVLRGEEPSEKSCVYNVAVIWDEMIHGSTFYEDERAVLEMGR